MNNIFLSSNLCAALFLPLLLLSACSTSEPDTTITPNPILLTAEEVGGGELTPFKPGDLHSVTSGCIIDSKTILPITRRTENAAQYVSGGRRIVVGVWENPLDIYRQNIALIRETMHSDYCTLGKTTLGSVTGDEYPDWRVYPLDFGENIAAFQSIEWQQPGSVPAQPTLTPNGWVSATARAYGFINNTYIMVRIDYDNTSTQPPTKQELHALWNAQAAKVHYYTTTQHTTQLLTPQSTSQ